LIAWFHFDPGRKRFSRRRLCDYPLILMRCLKLRMYLDHIRPDFKLSLCNRRIKAAGIFSCNCVIHFWSCYFAQHAWSRSPSLPCVCTRYQSTVRLKLYDIKFYVNRQCMHTWGPGRSSSPAHTAYQVIAAELVSVAQQASSPSAKQALANELAHSS